MRHSHKLADWHYISKAIMALLTWKDSYSVGVKELDAQHQKIFELINRLYSAIVDMKEKYIIESVVDELIKYADLHFSTEEKYFDLYDYPEKNRHKEKHKEYVDRVNYFRKEVAVKDGSMSREILDFLEDWWNLHVMSVDKGYSRFFNDHGLY